MAFSDTGRYRGEKLELIPSEREKKGGGILRAIRLASVEGGKSFTFKARGIKDDPRGCSPPGEKRGEAIGGLVSAHYKGRGRSLAPS